TAPVITPNSGPMATGRPITYTVTGAPGATVTAAGHPGSSSSGNNGPNIGAIVAGVVAGLLFLLACYLGFCIWVYRRQLALYKNHVQKAQAAAADPSRAEKQGFILPPSWKHSWSDRASSGRGSAAAVSGGARSGGQASGVTGGAASGSGRGSGSGSGSRTVVGSNGYHPLEHVETASVADSQSDAEDLLGGREPTFYGVLLNPRRSLRVINRD
ncbi:hypothetical protein LTS18_014463, partial [Coniosporium uncinatum]